MITSPAIQGGTLVAQRAQASKTILAQASTTLFEDIPQIVSQGYFLWLDDGHILLDGGSSLIFAETN